MLHTLKVNKDIKGKLILVHSRVLESKGEKVVEGVEVGLIRMLVFGVESWIFYPTPTP
jgi:hypothetical protein